MAARDDFLGRDNILYHRMRELGFRDVTEFVNDTQIDLSFETCRRAINEYRANIRHEFIVRIMQALDFTPQEIAIELSKRGDKHLRHLVTPPESGFQLSSMEELLIQTLREMDSPAVIQAIMQLIEFIKRAAKKRKKKLQTE